MLLALAAATVLPGGAASLSYRSEVHDAIAQVRAAPVAIVFGAGIWADGTLTPILADRVAAGVALYKAGKVERLLMSGDNGRSSYDEVTAMKRFAVELGVPPERVNLDYAGFRTYDSCYRARQVFGIQRAVLVTQRYHLPRAIYTARMLGIEATGYVAGHDQYAGQAFYDVREAASLVVAWYEVNLLHPLPRFLGDPVDLETQFR